MWRMVMENKLIYLDNAATTKVDEEVLKAYIDICSNFYANSSSVHDFGISTKRELDKAREDILNSLKLDSTYKVIFTSGATESINLFIKGLAIAKSNRGKHIVTSNMEHPAVSEVLSYLKNKHNFEITTLPIGPDGRINPDDLKKAMRDDTILVTIMAANNEIGSLNDVKAIKEIVKQYPKCYFHSDVSQLVGKVNANYKDFDAFSFSGHKFHGLKGSGALVLKKNISINPLIDGGGQEDGLRSGTVDVANAISLAKSLNIAQKSIILRENHILKLHNILLKYLLANPDLYEINSPKDAMPYIVNFSLKNKKASVIVEALSNLGFMISTTAACHSKLGAGSQTVFALGKSKQLCLNTLRVSFDISNTEDDVNKFVVALDKVTKESRYNG